MMYANSRVPQSAQTGIHERLAELVDRHRREPFRKPILDYNRAAFATAMAAWGNARPLILDAACGTGASSVLLGERNPDCFVIGVDQSEDRLTTAKGELPANLCLVRADLVDFWRLLAERGVTLERHCLFYPNPWPKIGHLARRWHGHAVFPVLPQLGGVIECRSNWRIYVEEFAFALGRVLGRDIAWEEFVPDEPVSPFERKYCDSGQPLYRCVVDLRDRRGAA
ncbi:tRNA (guanine(46)-N(7))-methyltransferase TrmB [Azospira restricta]|uniref:tRNA (guanine(46)-N(7))-methyltransferase n=1 Tax=Azospira restricta TaxID=404405 RepID=A0A974SSG0_9RHOO|nr:methyltransferase domain-containing protein [Azospira restricta]QRJ65708.1 SAM-dependent methyltransferase [Azospira restricta]